MKMIEAKYIVGAALLFVALGADAQKSVLSKVNGNDVEFAEDKANRLRFFEAYKAYRRVAFHELELMKADSTFDFGLGAEAFEKGIDCAFKAGKYSDALEMLDSLVINDLASQDDWSKRLEALLFLGEDERVDELLADARKQGLAATGFESLVSQRDDLRGTKVTDATLVKFRPSSTKAEFGAVPFGPSVLFVTPELGMGFGPGSDGWTGMGYNQIGFVQDADSADRAIAFVDKLKRKDGLGGALKGKYHNGHIALGEGDTLLILTQTYEDPIIADDGLKRYSLRLRFFAKGAKNDWSDCVERTDELFAFNDPNYDVCHAALDSSGNLIFSSNRPDGYGGMDLWKADFKDGRFGEPLNLGAAINTAGNEVFPFVTGLNKLYYSSNGRFGFGGLDVFRQNLDGSEMKLLGKPVNSNADDFAIVVDGSGLGYLSSNREEETDRIYRLHLREVYSVFDLEYLTCDSLPAANAPLSIVNRTTMQETTVFTDEEGKATLTCVAGDKLEVVFEGDDTFEKLDKLELYMTEEGTESRVLDVKYVQRPNVLDIQFTHDVMPDLDMEVGYMENGEYNKLDIDVTPGSDVTWDAWKDWLSIDTLMVTAIGYDPVAIELRDQNECYKPEDFSITMEGGLDLSLVLFDFDKASLRPIGKLELDTVVMWMNKVPYVTVELASHTDCRGSDVYNMALSQRRANVCVEYIINAGIDSSRITARGYGETMLLNECADGVRCDEEQHQANRRTEIHPITPGNN